MRFVVVGLALALAVSVSGQEMMPGTARPLIKDMPTTTSGYICPMHPNEVKPTPGTCSICGMTLVAGDPMATADYPVKVTSEPRAPKAGQKTKFRITVTHPLTGEPITQFAEVHDRLFHLFIVSRDMTQFFHEHPTLEKDGSLTIEHVLPAAGQYVLFSDFMPVGGGPQMVMTPIVTAGFEGDVLSQRPNLKPDTSFVKSANGTTLELQIDPAKVIAGEEADIPIRFTDQKTEQPVTNLQRYLGAFGHAMMLSEDMTEHVHAHPEEMLEGTTIVDGGGPDLVFHALFPKPGNYRIWLQFQRNDVLSTVPFTVRVVRSGETVSAAAR
jgi:hypothetical protein